MKNRETLKKLYDEHTGKVSDKWVSYLSEYARLFDEYRGRPVRILEIGVQNGGSLEIWSKFFPSAEKIIGCDVSSECANLEFQDSKISVVVGDANSVETEKMVASLSSGFDIIIDDGSHRSSDIIKSFSRYFCYLHYGGIYIVEDLHCSYWEEFEGGLFSPYSALTFFKRLVDVVNYEHWGLSKQREYVLKSFTRGMGCFQLNEILPYVHAVEFLNSMCAIRKEREEKNLLGVRKVVGVEALVSPDGLNNDKRNIKERDQSRNKWSANRLPPEEDVIEKAAELDKLANLNKVLQAKTVELEKELVVRGQYLKKAFVNLRKLNKHRESEKHLRAKLVSQKSQLEKIRNSTSWRITVPLRLTSRTINWVRRNIRRALIFVVWLIGGDRARAIKAALPYYRKFVPPGFRKIVPKRVRGYVKKRLFQSDRRINKSRKDRGMLPRMADPVSIRLALQEGALEHHVLVKNWIDLFDKGGKEDDDDFFGVIVDVCTEMFDDGKHAELLEVIPSITRRVGEARALVALEGMCLLRFEKNLEARKKWRRYWVRAFEEDAFERQPYVKREYPCSNEQAFPVAVPHRVLSDDLTARICVYTALFGDYDELLSPLYKPKHIDFICFSDRFRDVRGWDVRVIDSECEDPVLQNRKFKILPYDQLSEYDYSLYIDANVQFLGDPELLIQQWLINKPFVAWGHPERSSVYDECEEILSRLRQEPDSVIDQYIFFRSRGLPDNTGLIEAAFLWRDHGNSEIESLMRQWWKHLEKFPGRDQPGLGYLMWKTSIKPEILPRHLGVVRKNQHFIKRPHKFSTVKMIARARVGWDREGASRAQSKCEVALANKDFRQCEFIWLYSKKHQNAASTVMRGKQLSDIAKGGVKGVAVKYRDETCLSELRDAIVVLTKGLLKTIRPQQLEALRDSGNIICADYVDDPERHGLNEYLDAYIAASIKQYLHLSKKYPKKVVQLVTHHVDPTVEDVIPPKAYCNIGYYGEVLNAKYRGELQGIIDFCLTNTKQVDSSWVRRLNNSNVHYAVRNHRSIDGIKPFLKGFTAAACGANIIVPFSESDACFYLGSEYPYILHDTSLDSVLGMIDFVKSTFGKPEWYLGLEMMASIRRRSSVEHIIGELNQLVNKLLSLRTDNTVRRELICKAEKAFEGGDWVAASDCWNSLIFDYNAKGALKGRGKSVISIAKRLNDIESYKASIGNYKNRKEVREKSSSADGDGMRIAVYTAISNQYDTVKLPEILDSRFDYILFTDCPVPDTGVYDVRPMPFFDEDPTRAARYIKTHPHFLLRDYDLAIWIDANLMILDDIYPLISQFLDSQKGVGAIRHPHRDSVYEEAEACKRKGKDGNVVIDAQIERYRDMGFDCENLIESNLMFFYLRHPGIARFLNCWWREIVCFSKRDQLSLNYALSNSGVDWHGILSDRQSMRENDLITIVPHDQGVGENRKLVEAISTGIADPYAGKPYSEIRDKRILHQSRRRIDIVVCVHNAIDEVKKCLHSIVKTRKSDCVELIIVDDGSDKDTVKFLKDFRSRYSWATLYRNGKASGYTKAANKGISRSTAEMVVLLNSDTIVTEGWVEKLADALFGVEGAGIVGPLSNAASHQSIPDHRSTRSQTAINELPSGVTIEDMNSLCEKWSVSHVIPCVPLVHGFCFGIKRELIDAIGLLDEVNFPYGYGEENDYCLRAGDAGFNLVIATHTFVFHAKSKSYDPSTRALLVKRGSEKLRALHGIERVNRAVQSMQMNPLLKVFRERARGLSDAVGKAADLQSRVSGEGKVISS